MTLPARTRSEGPRMVLLASCTSSPAACWLKFTEKLQISTAQHSMYKRSKWFV
jgi:hypothetical protein